MNVMSVPKSEYFCQIKNFKKDQKIVWNDQISDQMTHDNL